DTLQDPLLFVGPGGRTATRAAGLPLRGVANRPGLWGTGARTFNTALHGVDRVVGVPDALDDAILGGAIRGAGATATTLRHTVPGADWLMRRTVDPLADAVEGRVIDPLRQGRRSQTRLHDQIDIEREYLESPGEIRTREELEDAGADIADQRFGRPEGGSRGIADDRPAWMAQSIEDPDTRLRPQEEGEGGFLYETARRLSQRSVTKQRAGDDAGTVAAGDIAAADNAAFETDPALARRSRAAIQEEIGQG